MILTEKNNKAEKKPKVKNPKVFIEFMLLLLCKKVTTEISKCSSNYKGGNAHFQVWRICPHEAKLVIPVV